MSKLRPGEQNSIERAFLSGSFRGKYQIGANMCIFDPEAKYFCRVGQCLCMT